MPPPSAVPSLLLIDDEPVIHDFVKTTVQELGIRLLSARSAKEGLAVYSNERPDVVVLDVGLPDLSGLEAFRRLHQIDARVPVIFITGAGTTATAIEAMSLGAFEYVLKPLEIKSLSELIMRAFEVARLMQAPALTTEPGDDQATADSLVGRGPAMHAVCKSIGRVAPQDVTVLILGESGTGKELVARAIYQHGRRKDGPFLAINCSAIPEPLLESELFGHEQGAFTGADKKRIGKFEQCNGGTLFLDEVGDMTPLTQTKILRLVQEQRFERVGGNETIQTNVRLIAATNRNLEKLVAEGKFRQDLYYRLSVFAIKLPALRERPEDLPTLVSYFLRRYALEMGKNVNGLAPATLELLKQYPWPGNIRELQSVIQHAILVASGSVIVPEFLPDAVRLEAMVRSDAAAIAPAAFHDLDQFVAERLKQGTNDLYCQWQNVTELHLFQMVLRHTDGNISKAAKVLGIHRATLRGKIAALGLDADERRGSPDELP
jgi:two-component system, NtrC family, nitrogen regulation response regulator GlnG